MAAPGYGRPATTNGRVRFRGDEARHATSLGVVLTDPVDLPAVLPEDVTRSGETSRVVPDDVDEGGGLCRLEPAVDAVSDHHMRDWPMVWRERPGYHVRLCSHGIGHPDPDDIVDLQAIGGVSARHRCDGCCIAPLRKPG